MLSKETLCVNCTHKDVCCLKEEFISIQRSIDGITIPDYFTRPQLACIHYAKNIIIRDDVLGRRYSGAGGYGGGGGDESGGYGGGGGTYI